MCDGHEVQNVESAINALRATARDPKNPDSVAKFYKNYASEDLLEVADMLEKKMNTRTAEPLDV